MRFVMALGALAAVQVVGVQPGQAYYDGPWCARFWGGDTEYENCGMRSFDMCLTEIRGTGGNTVCSPNPRFRPSVVEPRRHRRSPG